MTFDTMTKLSVQQGQEEKKPTQKFPRGSKRKIKTSIWQEKTNFFNSTHHRKNVILN
jgi:hypothetical protein